MVAPPKSVHNLAVDHLKRIRKARGLSQVDLADMVGVTQGLISKIENGDGNPTLDTLLRISRALKVSPAVLFGGLPDRHQRLIDAFEALDADTQDQAAAILEKLSRRD